MGRVGEGGDGVRLDVGLEGWKGGGWDRIGWG